MSKLILIFALIGLCLSDVPTFNCNTDFQTKLNTLCGYRGCEYFPARQVCTSKVDCSKGTSGDCGSIIPMGYPSSKCKWDGTSCIETDATCSDYTPTLGIVCTSLKPETGKGDKCRFSYSNECTPHYDDCEDVSKEKCTSNVPLYTNKKCVLNGDDCKNADRTCDDTFQKPTTAYCTNLKPKDNNKGCFFLKDENKDA